jgi:membrane protease subunit (stomatin/prohibitin family)
MSIFSKPKKGGMSDVIRCDEPNYLIWKWHPNGVSAGEVKRETAIRTNSILRVKNGEVAVFVYKQKNGVNEDYILGPYDEVLKSKNFPVLSSIIGLWYEGDTPFQAEVFFINLARAIQINFGVPYFDVVDPRFPDFQVPVAVRGTMTFKIEDYKAFVKYHQLVNFSIDDLKTKINATVSRYVKSAVTNALTENNIPLIAIESKIDLITEKIELFVRGRLAENFGVFVTGLDISAIEVDKDNDAYRELKRITKDITASQRESELFNYQEQLRIQREEGQYAQRMATRQTNLGAYQTEISGEVGVSGANALGKMGENGAGNVNIGGQGGGFNPMTIMAGMAVGSVVGQNIAGVMGTAMNPEFQASKVPPPVSSTKFFLEKDGNPSGPYDIATLKNMIITGNFKADSLVWKQGMNEWQRADLQSELAGAFPPTLPVK